jgi:hypothetical protein
MNSLSNLFARCGRLLAQLSTKKKGERKRSSKLKILELLHFVAMFSAPVDGSANHSDGWRRLRETARSRRPLFFFLPSPCWWSSFSSSESFSSFSLSLIFISTLFLFLFFLYVHFFSCFHSGCCIVTLFFGCLGLLLLACVFYILFFFVIVLVCSFSIFFFLRAISVDGFSLSLYFLGHLANGCCYERVRLAGRCCFFNPPSFLKPGRVFLVLPSLILAYIFPCFEMTEVSSRTRG